MLSVNWESLGSELLVSLGLQDEEPNNNNHQNMKLKFPRKLGFPQSLEVHKKPSNIPKNKPYLQKEGPDLSKEDPSLQKKMKYLRGN
jgi:hypothetical protein